MPSDENGKMTLKFKKMELVLHECILARIANPRQRWIGK
jgi:hypothetical protein